MMFWTSYPDSFHNSDAKFIIQPSLVPTTFTTRSGCCSCCCRGHSAVYCSRRRLCVLVFFAIFIALLMLAAGFVAGWFGSQLYQQSLDAAAVGDVINVTGKFDFPRLFSQLSCASVSCPTPVNLRVLFCRRRIR